MKKYTHIIQQAYNRPVLLQPGYAGFFYAYLSQRIGAESLVLDGEVLDVAGMRALADSYDDEREDRPYEVVNGVAVIPVQGTLVHKADSLDARSGLMGYNLLNEYLDQAEDDPQVKGVFFDIDSPGGAVSGLFDSVDRIANLSKPTAGFADEMACSAAYAIASNLGTFYVPRTACVGSIGVIMAHRDRSKQLEEDGLKVTLIYSGSHKADGNPYEPLPESVRADFQAELDDVRQLFAETVARGRGISVDAVLATEARDYNGNQAVELGLADAVMSRDQALNTFIESIQPLSSTGSAQQGVSMSAKQQARALAPATEPEQQASAEQPAPSVVQAISPADLNAAVAQAKTEAAQEEAARIYGVVDLVGATGTMATALELAKAGMEPAAAKNILDTLPVQAQTLASTGPVPTPQDKNAQALGMMADAQVVEPEEQPLADNVRPMQRFVV